jgi:hypothetical protein
MATTNPVAVRFSDEDWIVINDLRERTGLTVPGVLRLAIRALRDKLADEKPPKKQKRSK